MPKLLDNMILFISDRFDRTSLMVYDPAGNRFGQVTQPWVYVVGEARDVKAGDTQVRVQEVPCGGAENDEDFIPGGPTAVPDTPRRCNQILVRTAAADWREITSPGYSHYDPALSPDGMWVAYVSTIAGNDEIFKIKVDGTENTRLTENEWAWDKHPTWSPDGGQIAFWSNRDGRKQLYLMNADGSDPRNLSNNRFNDWDPVWAK
jgi:Tol biopolymer transport system component